MACGLGLLALAASSWLSPFNRIWTQVGIHLHRIVGTLVLAIVFFLVIAPTGLLMRAVGKDPLRLKFDKSAKSYWIDRAPPGPTAESLKNQF